MTSAQKLPTVFVSVRAKPRNSANAMAMPVAALRKLWIVSASIWLRFDSVASPEYHCQLVLVTKAIAVFIAPSAPTAAIARSLSGNTACNRNTA